MDHAVQRGGIKRCIQGKRLADVGLDGRDVQALQASRGIVENVRIGIEESDGGAGRQAGSFQEVSGTRANIYVSRADVPLISLHQKRRRAAPHHQGKEAEDHGVVDPEEERVYSLAPR